MWSLSRAILLNLALLGAAAFAAGEWDYKDKGPSKWAQLFPQFCAGDKQSPVDLSTQSSKQESQIKKFVFSQDVNGSQFSMVMKNDGHKIELNWSPELLIRMGISTDQLMYTAAQLHWHWGADNGKGSEHTLEGGSYPVEGHLVFYNSLDYASLGDAVNRPNGLAVLGVFYELSGQDNPLLTRLESVLSNDSLVNSGGAARMLFSKADNLDIFGAFLPAVEDRAQFFRYDGSLTTPSCYESVLWTVYRKAVPISQRQLDLLRRLRYPDGSAMTNNFRPPQALNPAGRAGTPRTLYRTFAAGQQRTAAAGGTVAALAVAAVLLPRLQLAARPCGLC